VTLKRLLKEVLSCGKESAACTSLVHALRQLRTEAILSNEESSRSSIADHKFVSEVDSLIRQLGG
jgi:hypothetical protein